MKKACLTALLLLSLSGAAVAAPLTDYSAGKTSIDISYMPNLDLSVDGDSTDGKSKSVDVGVTFGLGNNLALQYIHNSAKTDTTYLSSSLNFKDEITVQQFNILYKVAENASVFAGYTQAKDDLVTSIGTFSGKSIKGYQVGLQGNLPINGKLSSYGIISAGNKITSYELGLTQQINTNLDVNLFYKNLKYKDLEYNDEPDYKFDGKADGVGIGITYKF